MIEERKSFKEKRVIESVLRGRKMEEMKMKMKILKKDLHILVMPFPMQGHVNPLLHFSLNLALHGVKVSFVLPRSFKNNMDKAREDAGIPPPHQLGLGVDLRFLEIPDVIPPNLAIKPNNLLNSDFLKLVFEEVASSSRGFIEETILQSRNGPLPISCIVSDNFLYWTQDMADKLGIKRIWASTSNATTLATGLLAAKDMLCIEGGGPRIEDFLPGLDSVAKKGLLSTFVFNPESKMFVDMLFSGIGKSFCAVVNSFEGLESYVANDPFAMGVTPVRFLGPMLPPSFFGMDTARIEASVTGASTRKGEDDCIEWLDARLPSSVLYIAFGSVVAVSPEQLTELASGIEASQQAFLWVLHSPSDQCFPQGFLERSHGLGLVVSWVPQLRVLRHKSIGGYFTHCGWNSTLESISAGVPMLCMPLFADQPTNSLLITKHWKVGITLEKTKVGEDERGDVMMVTKDEVERKVRSLMRGGEEEEEDVVGLRDRTRELMEVARKAVFGSTNDGMCKLIADLQEVSKAQP